MQQSLVSYCVVHYVIHRLVISNKKWLKITSLKSMQLYMYLAGELVHLTIVILHSHFFTHINSITRSIQYFDTNEPKNLAKVKQRLCKFDSSYCTLLLKNFPLFYSVDIFLMRKEKVYISIGNLTLTLKLHSPSQVS